MDKGDIVIILDSKESDNYNINDLFRILLKLVFKGIDLL
jgi:hypothetical protein